MSKILLFVKSHFTATFFILLGVILSIVGVFYLNFYIKTINYPTIDAIVTETRLHEDGYFDGDDTYHEATYSVYIEYAIDGKSYNVEYGVFPDLKAGDRLTVSYDPDEPETITQPASVAWLVGIIMLAVASFVVGIFKLTRERGQRIRARASQ